MLETSIRPIYQKYCVDPFITFLIKYVKCSPNTMTLLALIVGLLVPIFLYFNFIMLAIILTVITGYLDTIDGSFARMTSKTSVMGTIYDIVVDRIVEFAIVLGLYLQNPVDRSFAVIAMLGSMLICITSFLVVGIFSQNQSEKSFHYSPGLMERAEAFIFFILMMIFPSYFNLLAWAFVILVCWTVFIRLKEARLNFR